MLIDHEDIKICTKVALMLILGPFFLLGTAIVHGIPIIINYCRTNNNQSVQNSTKEDNDEWFDVETIGDNYDLTV